MTASREIAAPAEHLLPLPGTEWSIWRTFVVRGAGMPFAWSEQLEERVAEPLVREALLWQNPTAAPMLLRPGRRWRARREVRASYLQRYTTKNDTIGFFGPTGWGAWVEGPTRVAVGERLIRSRTVRFERWAIAALGRALERRHGLRPWVAPVRAPSAVVHGDRAYFDPTPSRRDPLLVRLFGLVDGRRSARELALELAADGTSEDEVFAALEQLRELGAIAWELGAAAARGPAPERYLRGQLLRVGDASRRAAALADLDRLEAARGRVAEAAGDPDALESALADLQLTFEALAQTPATRAAGLYSGRFVVYEDTVRDATVELDFALAQRLGPPLGLLLASVRWLTCAVEQAYHAAALAAHARLGGGAMPFAWLLDEFFGSMSGPEVTALATPVAAELRRRWTEILAPEPGERVVERRCEELADLVAERFRADGPGWTCARYHSPDILVAADSVEALAAGVARFVIGELHVGLNTIDAPALVAQHDRPDALLAAVERDVPGRILPTFPAAFCNSRTYPPTALYSEQFTYVGIGTDPANCPEGATVLPLFDLVAVVEDGGLRVRARGDEAIDLPWSEVVGEYLSIACVNAFGVLEPAPHTPRVVVDDLVFARETWRFAPAETPFARDDRGAARHTAVREWAAAAGVPRHVFLTMPGSGKPQYVDVESELSVDVAARFVRRGIARDGEGDLLVREMLPGPDELWLCDAQDRRYTSELRMVCVDRSVT